MAGWRLARSLDTLRGEILARRPGTTVWTVGDQAHADTWSDHNPNASGVVCAIDVLGDRGLDLADFANRVATSKHPALKYVIYNRRIYNPASPGWRTYTGSNPHTTHVHISVGTGPDGRSTGPYDDTTPWALWRDDDMTQMVREMQDTLRAVGHDPGPTDGKLGPKTLTAWSDHIGRRVWAWQLADPHADNVLKPAGAYQRYTDTHHARTVARTTAVVQERADQLAALITQAGGPAVLDYDLLAAAMLRQLLAQASPAE